MRVNLRRTEFGSAAAAAAKAELQKQPKAFADTTECRFKYSTQPKLCKVSTQCRECPVTHTHTHTSTHERSQLSVMMRMTRPESIL